MIYLDFFGHLFSTESLEELYDFAVNRLGLNPKWNHYSRHFPHFDLTTKKMRAKAVKLGAQKLEGGKEARAKISECEAWARKEYPLPFYEGRGLHGQKILRVDFELYFWLKE